MLRSALASGLAALTVILTAPWLAEGVFSKPQLTEPLRWMALAVAPMSLLVLHGEVLKGLRRVRDSQLVQGVGVPGLSALALALLGAGFGVRGAVWAYVGASTVTALVGFGLWRMATPQLRAATPRFSSRELTRSSVPLFGARLSRFVMDWSSGIALGIWGSTSDVGIFNVAARVAILTGLILVAVNIAVVPRFAALFARNELDALGRTARNAARLAILASSPVLLILLFFPSPVMALFGSEFRSGATVLSILALGQFVNVSTG